jgi:hypothetical protein
VPTSTVSVFLLALFGSRQGKVCESMAAGMMCRLGKCVLQHARATCSAGRMSMLSKVTAIGVTQVEDTDMQAGLLRVLDSMMCCDALVGSQLQA